MPQTGGYRTETILDAETGRPIVVPGRGDDGQLSFYTLERRTGGMLIAADIPDAALRSIPVAEGREGRRLSQQTKAAADAVARKLAAGELERQARIEDLEARLEAQGAIVADLEARLEAATATSEPPARPPRPSAQKGRRAAA